MMSPDSDVSQGDVSVPDNTYVLRRIPPGRVEFDSAIGRIRPQSDNFKKNKKGPPSVFLGHLLKEQGREDLSVLDDQHAEYGLAKVSVQFLRDLGFDVVPVPINDELAHGHIIQPTDVGVSKLKKLRAQIACKAEWIKEPAPEDEP